MIRNAVQNGNYDEKYHPERVSTSGKELVSCVCMFLLSNELARAGFCLFGVFLYAQWASDEIAPNGMHAKMKNGI